jgi:urea transport system permease protein
MMAGMFLGVVLAFPDGLAGVYNNKVRPWVLKKWAARKAAPTPPTVNAVPASIIPTAKPR